MNSQPQQDMELLNTFVKSAQYIVGLSSHQDLWDHLGKLVVTYFKADWAAFVQEDPAGGLSIDHCVPPGAVTLDRLLTDEVRTVVKDVLDSGFLSSQVIMTQAPSMTVFLPVAGEHQPRRVLLIGHKTAETLPGELLNIYLALAGIAGSMLERLHVEDELEAHRAHLEELVKARTAELARAKHQNEMILNSIGEGIFGVGMDGRISFVNPAAGELTGWNPLELVGRNAHETVHHTKSDGSPQPFEECPIHGTLKDGQTRLVSDGLFFRKDGTSFPVEFKTGPITEEGHIIGAVLVFRDITERRRAAEEMERSNRELQQFAYVASHDLQEPLRMVSGFLQMLRDKYGESLDDKAKGYIQFAVDGAGRMSQLIRDLLEYSRVQTRERQPSPTDMNEVLGHAVANCSGSIAEAGATITYDDLPTVMGNQTQLTQLFQNLIGNALKFRRRGVGPVIHISVCTDKDQWLFCVQDNGIGIPEEQLERIFRIFQRLHTREQYPGTGIGLAICKKIIELHGGKIWVESKLGEGSQFLFTLPPVAACQA
jgi:PAS domain S-box-containing protein